MFITFHCQMKKLQREREVIVYLPDDYYQSQKKYPVLYIQDGQNAFFDHLSYSGVSWGFCEYVKKARLDIIMVAIPCNMEKFKREDEYGPWTISPELSYHETGVEGVIIGGEGKDYVDWMVYELKPYIDQRFQTDPLDCAIIGSSMGAIISTYATLTYPHVFHKCASLSTAFWFYVDEFKELIAQYSYNEENLFYFDLGEYEGCGDSEVDQWYIETNEIIYSLLKYKIKNLEYRFFPRVSHNEYEWRQRLPEVMKFLYGE